MDLGKVLGGLGSPWGVKMRGKRDSQCDFEDKFDSGSIWGGFGNVVGVFLKDFAMVWEGLGKVLGRFWDALGCF